MFDRLFDDLMRLLIVLSVVTFMMWIINMVANLLVPTPERAGAPMEVPLTPIYKVRPQ